ncbi:hypothetical protein LCGC14_1329140 [marine sediment metagenome]|uniref:Uncharacterized protein n=1 Tax=marine sediment metagenome TaxID=412755 RepID=A0A0F9MXZ0_9ZZZZ
MRFLKAKTQFACFAPIDLKQADFYVRDGWGGQSGVSSVTNTSEEPLAETVIALTTCNLVVPVGMSVHFGNDSTDGEYIVASRTTSGGTDAIWTIFLDTATGGDYTITMGGQTTNSIAFDAVPATIELELQALDAIGFDDVVVTKPAADIILTFADDLGEQPVTGLTWTSSLTGAGAETFTNTTPGVSATNTATITLTAGLAELIAAGGTVTFTGSLIAVRIGEGNMTYDETKNRDYILDRGIIDTVRPGDDVPMDVSFDFVWEYITAVTDSAVPTIEDALKQRGEASAWVTTSSDECEEYCVDLEIHYDPQCGGTNSEKIVFPFFRYEKLTHNIKDSQISCTGKCNATEATATRGS